MNFILNEKSLHGQFKSVDEFLKSLEPNLQCFRLVRSQEGGVIRKMSRLRIALDKEIRTEPYWDFAPEHDYGRSYWMGYEDMSATAVAEAAARQENLLSFDSAVYSDCKLCIKCAEKEYSVISIYHPAYLEECFGEQMGLERDERLKARYAGTRLDCSLLEKEYGAERLEKDEYDLLIGTLDKFVKHESWESIGLDDGLEYKKYTPSSVEEDWFRNSAYSDQTIMKFRFSSRMRCFGYRKGDRFRLLRIERDHKRSNKG